ncbi:hypothetical protein GVY41_02720 [Frigidibacter albus]|uniref:Putative Flp pilus-assembly TadG-like N-terminal domain-containing protein n=1 Tax=Frigidibacter albus TaxID=1465486 RepID=A0A6L8VGS4_9RHOB|nr:pilus assembly protein TadG-related protein [Frigidibacter albus]MZQ88410.1 hypothetical protein [Frigidibacter albus]NBE29916.1 hypothetical protein [Frigidibacter albus]
MTSFAGPRFRSATARPAMRAVAAANTRTRRFRRDEDGSILVFGLLLFTAILLLVGVSLDMMRFETERTRAQYTLDRAVLAAADISQTADAQVVVDDYFKKAGVEHFDPVATATKGTYNEWKKVVGTLNVSTNTWFMNMVGVKQLKAPAAATAEEKIGNVEISMVLDVSGSMNDEVYDSRGRGVGTKLELLRPAAQEFVTTMFKNVSGAGTKEGKLSISLVPYAEQVNLGSSFSGYFNLSSEHSRAACVDFTGSDFNSLAITPTQALPRTAYAYVRSNSSTFRECTGYDTTAIASVLPFSTAEASIKSAIGALTAEGDTAIDIGAKWGMALLDPAAKPALDAMITAKAADASITGRPFSYTYPDTLKILVLMTDGENTNTYRLMAPYRAGISPVYKDSNNKYYYYRPDRDSSAYDFYSYDRTQSIQTGTVRQCDWRGRNCKDVAVYETTSWFRASDINGEAAITWPQVWEAFTVNTFSSQMYAKAMGVGSSVFYNAAVDHANNDTKDDRLDSICTAAKNKDVLVFAIAYDASDRGQKALKDCVSASSYYYDAQGTTIADAFAGIANSINMLRLTQ